MISKIDITAYFLVEICNEILSVINHRKETDNISDLVKECIANNKEQVNLEGFWLNEPAYCFPETFWVEFFFKNENDSFKVKFSNTGSANRLYHAIEVSPYIIVTKQLSLKLDGLMYCSPNHRILYVDYFTDWVPLCDEDKCLSVEELINECRTDFDNTKKEHFLSFYQKLSEGEMEELSIANIDFWNIDNKGGDNYKYLLSRIRDMDINMVITSDIHAQMLLKSILPPITSFCLYNEPFPLLAKQQWVSRAVNQINDITSNEPYSLRITEIRKWMSMLMRQYQPTRSMIRESCKYLPGFEGFYSC